MSVTNCDAHFFNACNLYIICTTKGSPDFWTFFNLRFMICFFNFSIMRQFLYNNQVVYDSSSSMDLSIVP